MINKESIKNSISFINNNRLINVLSFNSLAVFLNLISSFVSIKFIAHFIGAEGLALLGNFKNFTTSIRAFSTVGYDHGIVKLIAENSENKKIIKEINSTSFFPRLFISILISVCILIFSKSINTFIFVGNSYNNVIIIFAVFLPIYSLNTFLISIINGFQKFRFLITINIFSNLTGLIITIVLIWKEQLLGALIALATLESFIIFITFYFLKKAKIQLNLKFSSISQSTLKKLLKFSLMALVTAVVVPGSNFLIRNIIIVNVGLNQAGQWEALSRISTFYMMIVSSGFTIYYLPKLSSLKTDFKFKKELINYYKIILPIFIICTGFVYILRNQIILIALNKDFLSISSLFIWQIIGDFFKILYLAFSYQILAKAMVKKYIFIEIIYFSIYTLFSLFLINFMNIKGVLIGYILINFLTFLSMLFMFRKVL